MSEYTLSQSSLPLSPAPPAPAAKPPSKRGKGKSEGLTSLPSDVEESEEDAESTGSEEDSVESD